MLSSSIHPGLPDSERRQYWSHPWREQPDKTEHCCLFFWPKGWCAARQGLAHGRRSELILRTSNNRVIMDTGASWIDLAVWLFPVKCEAAVALYLLKSLESVSKGRLSPISSSLPTPSMQLCFLKTERSRDSQLAELHKKKKKKKTSCLSYLRAKQWDIDSATTFPMPLSGDKEDSQQNKKQIWTLLKAVTQTDSGHFPQATKWTN